MQSCETPLPKAPLMFTISQHAPRFLDIWQALFGRGALREEPCERCKGLLSEARRIDTRSSSGAENSSDVMVGKLEAGETRDSLSRSSCPMCVLLGGIPGLERIRKVFISGIIKPENLGYLLSRDQTPIKNTTDGQDESNPILELQLLGTLSSHYETLRFSRDPLAIITCVGQNQVSIPEDLILCPEFVSYSQIKEWLGICRADPGHQSSCSLASLALPVDFRLIDVWDGRVVRAPEGAEYIALSYVWGGNKPKSRLPQVVVDSMQVARELGYRYLWVDQYCINQRDAENKHLQISSMHLVYGRADLTLIAAAGADSTYGLPGVHKPRHGHYQPRSARHGNIMVCQLPPQLSRTIAQSPWNSRGWTYQEALLTRRRLVFTDHFVIFQCNRDTFGEGFHWSLDNQPFDLTFSSRIANSQGPCRPRLQLSYLLSQIQEYSKKQLTYESDRLDAFLGILGDQEAFTPPIHHIWGVPVVTVSMQWIPVGLAWYRDVPASREATLPSWSWTSSCAGSGGAIKYPVCIPFRDRDIYFPFRAWLATDGSRDPTHLISLDTLASSNRQPRFSTTDPKCLKLEGNMGLVSLNYTNARVGKCGVVLETGVQGQGQGQELEVRFYADEPKYALATQTPRKQVFAFEVTRATSQGVWDGDVFMVVVLGPNGFYQRIGAFTIDCEITLRSFREPDLIAKLSAWRNGLKKREIWVI